VAKLRPASRVRPADQFNLPRRIPCIFFPAPRFRLWPGVQQHWLLPVSCWLVCRSSTCKQLYESVNKIMRCYCYYCTTIHFTNQLLHRLRKLHCIRLSNGQAVAISALGSKRLATLALGQWYSTGAKLPTGERFYALWGRFCDLPDLVAISVFKRSISAG